MKIAVVEDEFTIRNGLCQLIPRLNPHYKVVGSAEDGYEGMNLIKKLRPDVAICDIQMKKITGLEMIRQLNDANIPCRYIILSGYSEFRYAQTAIGLGVAGYLLKPILPEELLALLQKLDTEPQISNIEKKPVQKALSQKYSPLIQAAVDKITNDYSQDISLAAFARELGVTPEYLSSRFTQETGENFMLFLRNHRIRIACNLLENTDKKIYEIAFMTGYDNPQYFSNVFKSVMGMSPKSYLRNLNKAEKGG